MTGAYNFNPKKMALKTEEKTATEVKTEEKEQNKYELMVIMLPDLSKDEIEKELNKFRKQINDLKGEIYHEDIWDVRDLAYIIKKYEKGYYVIFYFTFDSDNLNELEKDLILDKKVLRHIIVKSPKKYTIKPLAELEVPLKEKKEKPVKEEKPKRAEKIKEEKLKKEPEKVREEAAEEKVKKEESKEKPKEEKEEKKEEPKKEEEKKMDISDLDSKLESILDDPDIDIKL